MFRTTHRPSVLLVEDSEDDAFFFMRSLRLSMLGGQTTHVADGGLAIRFLERGMAGEVPVPDFIFLDLKLPTFSGFEVLTWIRAQQFDPLLEIAVLSGSEQGGDVERALALGAMAYFVKPILIEQLNLRFSTWRGKQTSGMNPRDVHVAIGPNGPL